MAIEFDPRRWEKIAEDARAWWAGQLERPLMQVRLRGADPGRAKPDIPARRITSHYDLSIPAEEIVDRWDYDLSRTKFLGDAFPNASPNFGAGALAAFLGARIYNTEDATWFVVEEELEIGEITLEWDADEEWFERAKEVCRAAIERWRGAVQVDMVDLGGTLDVLSTFRPSDKLMFDLFDDPEVVERVNWRIHELWMRYFDEFSAILQPANPGYTTWTPIFSEEPTYMLQSGFSFSLSPDMFQRFVKPQLEAACRALPNAFYHLDGPGQLNHLDSLLEIEELKGLRWDPGEGNTNKDGWIEVYGRIRDAGRLVQIGTSDGPPMEDFERIVDRLGSAKGLVWIHEGDISEEEEWGRFLEEFGAA